MAITDAATLVAVPTAMSTPAIRQVAAILMEVLIFIVALIF
jgi:hypothetical protein